MFQFYTCIVYLLLYIQTDIHRVLWSIVKIKLHEDTCGGFHSYISAISVKCCEDSSQRISDLWEFRTPKAATCLHSGCAYVMVEVLDPFLVWDPLIYDIVYWPVEFRNWFEAFFNKSVKHKQRAEIDTKQININSVK